MVFGEFQIKHLLQPIFDVLSGRVFLNSTAYFAHLYSPKQQRLCHVEDG
ncbi:MAG: hypothetical protein FADNKDHG_01585 [Holosporales bacterium]